jgi:hypothetical protein
MGTLRSAWTRLKAQLDAAMKSKPAAGAKADPKKTAAAIQQFLSKFAAIMAEFEDAYKLKAQVDVKLRKASEEGLKLLQPILQQVDAAHKDGFNPDNSLQENVDGRLDEVIRLLKELKSNGCQVQWD